MKVIENLMKTGEMIEKIQLVRKDPMMEWRMVWTVVQRMLSEPNWRWTLMVFPDHQLVQYDLVQKGFVREFPPFPEYPATLLHVWHSRPEAWLTKISQIQYWKDDDLQRRTLMGLEANHRLEFLKKQLESKYHSLE